MSNIRTLSDLQVLSTGTNRRAELLRIIRERLDGNDYRLPFLDNAPDARIIVHLNSTLNQEDLKLIMESLCREEYNIDVLKLILNSIPNEFLLEFLGVRGTLQTNIFENFLNFLLYCSIGIGDFATTQAILNDVLVEMLSTVNSETIDSVELIENSENERTSAENDSNERSVNFANNMNRIGTSMSGGTIFRRTITLTTIGAAVVWGQPIYGSILTTFGGAVGSTLANNIAQSNVNNAVIPRQTNTNDDVSVDVVITAISKAFSLLRLYMFGK